MTDYSKLTDTEINERLAGLMWYAGYSLEHAAVPIQINEDGDCDFDWIDWHPADDLNQMHLVEDRLIELGLWDRYTNYVITCCVVRGDDSYAIHATARQKAIAALMAWEGRK